jgi:hypothetical protein
MGPRSFGDVCSEPQARAKKPLDVGLQDLTLILFRQDTRL